MYYVLRPAFIGRDKFIEIFMDLGFRVKRNKNYQRTTYSLGFLYPNLIKGMKVISPGVIWQSDITYFYINGEYYYGVFIIDVYSKKIVGYSVNNHLRAEANLMALKMALKENKPPTIHHSDKGSQYGSLNYLQLLKDNGCAISMCDKAQDNAYAERINLTIKDEYIERWQPKNLKELKRYVTRAVHQYNYKRPHNHLKRIPPATFENLWYNNELKVKPEIWIWKE